MREDMSPLQRMLWLRVLLLLWKVWDMAWLAYLYQYQAWIRSRNELLRKTSSWRLWRSYMFPWWKGIRCWRGSLHHNNGRLLGERGILHVSWSFLWCFLFKNKLHSSRFPYSCIEDWQSNSASWKNCYRRPDPVSGPMPSSNDPLQQCIEDCKSKGFGPKKERRCIKRCNNNLFNWARWLSIEWWIHV